MIQNSNLSIKRAYLGSNDGDAPVSINVTKYNGWKKFTKDNFACGAPDNIWTGQPNTTSSHTGNITYNASTGVVTFPAAYEYNGAASGNKGIAVNYAMYLYYI